MFDRRSTRFALSVLSTGLLLSSMVLGCSDGTTGTDVDAPAALLVVSGNDQVVLGARRATQPLAVRVVDLQDRPIAGVRVKWRSTGNVALLPASSTSGPDGIATTEVQVGVVYNTTIQVSASVAGVPPTAFALTVLPGPVTDLALASIGTMSIGEHALLSYSALTPLGPVQLPRSAVSWSSTITSVARISAEGVVTAFGTGNTVITAFAGEAAASVTVYVTGRIQVGTAFNWEYPDLTVGDSVQLEVSYVDVNGNRLGAKPNVTWTSNNPQQLKVTPTGLVIGESASEAGVGVVARDGVNTGSMSIRVLPRPAGSATVRFVHAVSDYGPMTLHPSRGDPVALSFEQVVERTYTSGLISVAIPGGSNFFFNSFVSLLAPDNPRTVYVSGTREFTGLIVVSDRHDAVANDSVLARVVLAQGYIGGGWTYNVYLLPPGAPLRGNADFCYFEFGATGYMRRKAGEFDIVIIAPANEPTFDNPGVELARVRARPEPGKASTFVVIGHSAETVRVMTVIDR